MIIMVACCLVPLVVIGILWATGVRESYLLYGLVLICPLTHVLMMLFMRKKEGDDSGHLH